jgi:hypothetical protein
MLSEYLQKRRIRAVISAAIGFLGGARPRTENPVEYGDRGIPMGPHLLLACQRDLPEQLLTTSLPDYLLESRPDARELAYYRVMQQTQAEAFKLFGRLPLPFLRLHRDEPSWALRVTRLPCSMGCPRQTGTSEEALVGATADLQEWRQRLVFLYTFGEQLRSLGMLSPDVRDEYASLLDHLWARHRAALSEKIMLSVLTADGASRDASLDDAREFWPTRGRGVLEGIFWDEDEGAAGEGVAEVTRPPAARVE